MYQESAINVYTYIVYCSACVSAKDDETSLSVIRTFLQQKVRRHQMNKIFRDKEATAAADAAAAAGRK